MVGGPARVSVHRDGKRPEKGEVSEVRVTVGTLGSKEQNTICVSVMVTVMKEVTLGLTARTRRTGSEQQGGWAEPISMVSRLVLLHSRIYVSAPVSLVPCSRVLADTKAHRCSTPSCKKTCRVCTCLCHSRLPTAPTRRQMPCKQLAH